MHLGFLNYIFSLSNSKEERISLITDKALDNSYMLTYYMHSVHFHVFK